MWNFMDMQIGSFLHERGYSREDISIKFNKDTGWYLYSDVIPIGILKMLEKKMPK